MPKPTLAQCPTGLADVYAPNKGKACGPTGPECISFLNGQRLRFLIWALIIFSWINPGPCTVP